MSRRGSPQQNRGRSPVGGAPVAAAWTPASLTSLKFLLDPALGITMDGSNKISAWADQSAAGIITSLVQATGANQPLWVASGLNSQPAVRFDGAAGYLSAPAANLAAGGNTFSVIAVVKPGAALASSAGIFSKTYLSSDYTLGGSTSGGKVDFWCGGVAQKGQTNAAVNTSGHTLIGTYNGGATPSTILYLDGTAQTTTGTTTGNVGNTSDRVAVGALVRSTLAGTTSFYNGDILYVAVQAAVTTSAERALLVTYFNTRFGI